MPVIGTIDTSIPDPVPPDLALNEIGKLVTAAIGLAFLIFPEGVLLGRAVSIRHRYEINPDRELVALGAANLAAGLLHSFSVGASQTRTLLNDATGGRSQMVSLIAALLLVTFIVFLGTWIATVPSVAIAAILVFTGFTLVDVAGVKRLHALHPYSAWLSLLTSAAVIALGVLPGIILGIVLSLLMLLSQIVRPQDALLGRVEGSQTLHDVGDDDKAQTLPGLVVYRFYGPLVFANIRYFIERLEGFIASGVQPVRQVIIDARAIPSIDITAVEQLQPFVERLRDSGIEVVLAKAHLPLRVALQAFREAENQPQRAQYFSQLADAVAAFEASTSKSEQDRPKSE
jgi:SulP family sulfate permease